MLRLEDFVIFAGNVDNAEDYYQAMDTFILPSRWEGLPFVTIEAQAAGLPCIVSNSIPEAAIISDNIKRLRLEDFSLWVDACVSLRYAERKDDSKLIRQAGYDIHHTTKKIRNLYVS